MRLLTLFLGLPNLHPSQQLTAATRQPRRGAEGIEQHPEAVSRQTLGQSAARIYGKAQREGQGKRSTNAVQRTRRTRFNRVGGRANL